MRYFQIIALAACILLPASAIADDDADYEAGLNAYIPRDYKIAMDIWQPLADKGHAGAQCYLGWMYARGEGVPEDNEKAAAWYRKAAEQGHAEAQYHLGKLYNFGRGVPKDNEEARAWYQKAAEQGHAEAQYALGRSYWYPLKDYAKATLWYLKAAEQGHISAQIVLAKHYFSGKYIPQSDAEAVAWWRKLAEQGEHMFQSRLGRMYLDGRGVPQSAVHAYAWCSAAIFNGVGLLGDDAEEDDPVKEAQDCLLQATRSMSTAQNVEGLALTAEFLQQFPLPRNLSQSRRKCGQK